MQLRKCLLLSFLLGVVLFSGCIPVDDISAVWEGAVIDPELEGYWKQTDVEFRSQDQYLSFVKKGNAFEVETIGADYSYLFDDMPETPNPKAKCLSINGWGILIIDTSDVMKYMAEMEATAKGEEKKEDVTAQSGGLDLYKIENGILSLYRLKQSLLSKAISDKKIDGYVDQDDIAGPHIKKLDIDTIKYIITLANQSDNIEQVMKYERVQDLQKALNQSREYPAMDETLNNTIIDVNLPELKYFAEGKTQILLSQLQASPEWQVRDKNGEIICSKRTYQNGKWQGGFEGYESTFDKGVYDGEGFYQIRGLFRFSKEPYGFHAVWAKGDYVIKVGPEVGKVNLKLKLDDQGITSYLAIGQEGLWYEFYEQRKKEPRIHTRKALAWLKSFLLDIKKTEKEIQQNGYAKDLLPKNSIKTGKPSIDIQESPERRYFTINAWINPQKSGYVYLKLFDNITNKQQSAHTIKFTTNEFIGYSSNQNELFSYNCSVSDYDDEWDKFNEARFEIWFHPNDGGQEVKLIEAIKISDKTIR